jgi:hypothetical protein
LSWAKRCSMLSTSSAIAAVFAEEEEEEGISCLFTYR